MIYAVDFDGTIVENKYPDIGDLFPHCLETLYLLQASGNEVILWSCRTGDDLDSAVDFLSKNGFVPSAINDHSEAMKRNYPTSRPCKIYADVYIDDHNINIGDMKIFWKTFYETLKKNKVKKA